MNPLILIPLVLLGIAASIIVLAQRSPVLSRLVPWLAGAGLAGSLLVALYTFTTAAVPIAPYETSPGAWTQIYWALLLSAFAGFGLGVILVSLFTLPITYFKNRRGDAGPSSEELTSGEEKHTP